MKSPIRALVGLPRAGISFCMVQIGFLNRPRRGPNIAAATRADVPPRRWTTPEPAMSMTPVSIGLVKNQQQQVTTRRIHSIIP